MRFVDLRTTPTPAPVSVEVRASEAAELLRLIGVVCGEDDDNDYDVGRTRATALREALDPAIVAKARGLSDGDFRAFFSLSNLAARLDPPGDVDQLLALLDAEPRLPWQTLLSLAAYDLGDAPANAQAIAAGVPEALAELEACCDDPDWHAPEVLRRLLDADPEAHGRAVAEVVEHVYTAVWGRVADEAMGAIGRDADHRRARIDAGDDPATLVLEATNGYALEDDSSIRRVLVLPSFWLRPWLIVDHLPDVETLVLSTPVADAFVALPPEVPAPGLLKLTKAVSDEGRLKLLRRMTSGPISLGEATERLGVTKATAHHHLSILRQAGLVTMRGGGRNTRYALRVDPADAAREAIAAYVPLCWGAHDRGGDEVPAPDAADAATDPGPGDAAP